MTDHEGNRNLSGSGIQGGGGGGQETVDYCPTESREQNGFFCWPRDQSFIFVL